VSIQVRNAINKFCCFGISEGLRQTIVNILFESPIISGSLIVLGIIHLGVGNGFLLQRCPVGFNRWILKGNNGNENNIKTA
jgi:hypothetical protein